MPAADERNRFIEKHYGLVHACCHRFTGRGVDYEDLFQAGSVGLIKAADAFDESRNVWKHTEEGFSATVRECSFPFYEWLCIFGSKKPPRVYCSDDEIHFTVFYYAGEWRVFFWPLRGES